MRVAVVAGPDPGHAFPALALSLKLKAAGDEVTLLTGAEWLEPARAAGLAAVELAGLDATDADDDADAGAKLHQRAARMAVLNVPRLGELDPELVVSDVITVCGGLAAELLGVPWVELNPHPLYQPSKGLPPLGSGLAPGIGVRGRLRDAAMRSLTARSVRIGQRNRAAVRVDIGLPAADPGPVRRLIATLPALEVPRPDWPAEAVVARRWRTAWTCAAPSTATTGTRGLAELALDVLRPGSTLPAGARVVVSRLGGSELTVPPWATVGLGRQDELLARADLAICGSGHGIVAKALLAGVAMVVVPGGGDQWEIANRVARQGSAVLIRPLTAEALVAAAGEVLASPSYRSAARRASATIADVADPVRVCHEALDVSA